MTSSTKKNTGRQDRFLAACADLDAATNRVLAVLAEIRGCRDLYVEAASDPLVADLEPEIAGQFRALATAVATSYLLRIFLLSAPEHGDWMETYRKAAATFRGELAGAAEVERWLMRIGQVLESAEKRRIADLDLKSRLRRAEGGQAMPKA